MTKELFEVISVRVSARDKAVLDAEAASLDRSTSWVLRQILAVYAEGKRKEKNADA